MAEKMTINQATTEMLDVIYKPYLSALNKVLAAYKYMPRQYSILYPKDESMCLECVDGLWQVYYSERGRKTDLRESDDINEACLQMISMISDNEEEEISMKQSYKKAVESISPEISVNAVYKLMQKIFKNIAMF